MRCSRLLIIGLVLTISSNAWAIPQMMNYQGILLDNGGNPVTTPTSVLFAIWDDPVAGDSLWSEAQSVTPDADGRFTLLLGSVTPIPDSALAGDAFISLNVDTDPEMSPRSQLVAVAYALRTGTVDGASGGNITSKISIGTGHTNSGVDAFVAGAGNEASGDWSTIPGGKTNLSTGPLSVVSGGWSNAALGRSSTIGGGTGNLADSLSMVGGGSSNYASGGVSSIVGGEWNSTNGAYSSIGGGLHNRIRGGDFSTISGGQADSIIFAKWAAIPGGRNNSVAGDYGFAAGRRASSNHVGAFVWADSTDADFTSTGANQFLVRAGGGMGINTNAPSAALHVGGTPGVDGIKFPDGTLQTTAYSTTVPTAGLIREFAEGTTPATFTNSGADAFVTGIQIGAGTGHLAELYMDGVKFMVLRVGSGGDGPWLSGGGAPIMWPSGSVLSITGSGGVIRHVTVTGFRP